MARRAERVGGSLAVAIGLVLAATIWAFGGSTWTVAPAILSAIGAGIGAYMHSNYGKPYWLVIFWGSTVALVVVAVLTALGAAAVLLGGG
ncbi:MAG: hypothetical protein ACYC4L_06845 [Chloroflexota bacterium]